MILRSVIIKGADLNCNFDSFMKLLKLVGEFVKPRGDVVYSSLD